MKQRSPWRDQARQVILRVLADLPDNATQKDARTVLREAYPFGPRQYHPYRIWTSEVRLHLAARFGTKKVPQKPQVTRSCFFWAGTRHGKPRDLWLDVYCPWCGNVPGMSLCLVCAELRQQIPAVVSDPEFLGLRQEAIQDTRFVKVLIDWLAERGIEVAAPQEPPG